MKMVVNTCNIDTIYGNRTINLIREDISETQADLIVFSTHADNNRPIEGEVYEALKKVYKVNFQGKGNVSMIMNGVSMHYWREKQENKERRQGFLMARIPTFSEKKDKLSTYDKNIRAIFATIKALEFNDNVFESISLPIIEGNKNIDYYESIKILLKYAIKLLKESKNTEVLNFYILRETEEGNWNKAFEKTLGRTYYKQGSLVVIESLIVSIKEIISDIFKSGEYKELEYILRIIESELDEVDSLSINSIAINSRKISEIIAKSVASKHNLNIFKIKYDLSSILNLLSSKDILAPWIIQYLHMSRVFGNKSAHVETSNKYVPKKFYNSDFISILSSLYNILAFWYYNKDKI
ncbi:MAG: hypothetical protein GX309_11250 [Clostridiales bacterium]|nr:hypothetical protein [Clostridiales bacterium]